MAEEKPVEPQKSVLDLTDAELLAMLRVEAQTWRKRAVEAELSESRWRAVVALLLRQMPVPMASLSLDVLDRMREEGLEVERVLDLKRRECLVRLVNPAEEQRPPEKPLGKLKGEEAAEAAGGGTPCLTKMPPPKA